MTHGAMQPTRSTLSVILTAALVGCGGDEPAAPVADSTLDTATEADTSIDDGASDVATETTDAPTDGATKQLCATCHSTYMAKLDTGKHKDLKSRCLDCHKDALAHQVDPGTVKASVDFSLDVCATCHADHKTQFLYDDKTKPGKYGGSIKTSKYLDFPAYQHLMGGHGFTLEYNEDTAHANALKDHIDIKRKQNAVCLQCKSTAVAYYWGELRRGQPTFGKDITWADSITKIKTNWPSTIDHGTSCNHCHDPHTTRYRLVRKQMINAILERGTDPYDAAFNFVPKTITELEDKLNEKGTDGKLTLQAKRLVGTLTCAQCHVEYTCGPGVDKTVIRDDFPWRKLRDIEAYYKVKYDTAQDWTHSGTGLKGIKAQHPETEFYWESMHYRAGATCVDCHLGLGEPGKPRSHWFTSPFKQPEKTCGNATCHGSLAGERAKKAQDIQDTVMAQAKTVELGLDAVLTKIEALTTAGGFDAAKLLQAKEHFMKGLLWWEFTVVSENSAGFHNPTEAKTNLDTAQASVDAAKALLGL